MVLENLHLILMLISLVMNEADVFFHIIDFILKRRYLATLIHNWFESLTEPPSQTLKVRGCRAQALVQKPGDVSLSLFCP